MSDAGDPWLLQQTPPAVTAGAGEISLGSDVLSASQSVLPLARTSNNLMQIIAGSNTPAQSRPMPASKVAGQAKQSQVTSVAADLQAEDNNLDKNWSVLNAKWVQWLLDLCVFMRTCHP